ncbi:hypothetical protein [Leptospira stimsonii]|uniref:Trimeric autotransporter adhesin YadA-like stalk domain-containing protein n=1 Tax=Leptospira stimsonii TaxID=2202203 RepID=A0ABY2N570_9LEPT|nr:hypothetical protein [Leptospira stimsonii]TGK10345.1 hypothetical protein EHO98_22800 [Leptospira stimsonii]TGM17252.1 hypothetical protein EHQ90_07665 [Leptospira stimsonii]
MSKQLNHRYHPILKRFIYGVITEDEPEIKVCGEIEEYLGTGTYGFRLDEVPEKRTPVSTLKVQRVSDNQNFTEVVVQPGPLQFYSNYHNDVFSRDGLIILDEVNDGESFRIWYEPCGPVNSFENQKYVQDITLLEKLSRDGSLPMLGDLNMDLKKILNLAAGTNPTDAVNYSQLDSVHQALVSEVTSRTSADATINSKLNPLLALVKWDKFSLRERDYGLDSPGTLGMESYVGAGRKSMLFWYNVNTGIAGVGPYGNGSSDFQIIDDRVLQEYQFRWTHPSHGLMRWILVQWTTDV